MWQAQLNAARDLDKNESQIAPPAEMTSGGRGNLSRSMQPCPRSKGMLRQRRDTNRTRRWTAC
jgi:hypothetical protein